MKKLSHLVASLGVFLSVSSTTVIANAADIVDTAVNAGQFKTLAAALTAGGLVETLKGKGPFTVFAPTDESFAKLPAGTVDDLLKPENKSRLIKILTYHVVAAQVLSSDLAGKKLDAKTVEGRTLAIDATTNTVKVKNGNVTKADIKADNGVLHIVDTVLLP
ncbi:MAG: fasciclin domain-containing protein [Alphaproteobacteria bacterium]|nr:fasciclin domain-containing protein [Alphaproteobacteria bacterium]